MPQPENPGSQGNKPTEQEKKDKKTEHKTTGTFKTAEGHPDRTVDVVAKTTPNANGGYDTVLEMGVPK